MAVSNQISITITGTSKQLEAACKAAASSISGMEKSISASGSSAKSAASGGYTVMKNVLANLATGVIAKTASSIKDFASSVVTTGAQFDSTMSKVAAISGTTGDELLKLRNKAKEMGATTKFTASESAEAFTYMAMAGWKTGDMLDGISGIMNLAAASGSDLATTSDIVTDALTAFGLTAKDSGRFADVLAAASSNANTNVEMMGATFKYAAPVAGALGYTIEDTAVAIGLMANAGIKADQAGTSLRSIMQRLASDTGGAATAAKALGVEITNADGSMRPLSEVTAGLRKAFAGLSQEEKVNAAKTIAGANAMSGLLAIVNSSDDDFNKLTSAVNDSSGAAENMANTMLDNAEGAMTLFDSKLEGIKVQIWEGLEPAIRSGIDALSGLLDVFEWLVAHSNEVIGVITGIGTAIAAYKVSTAIVTELQKGYSLLEIAQLAVMGVQEKLAVVQGVLNAVMSANPIGIIIALIAGLVAAFIYLWNTSEDFRNFWAGVWEAIKNVVGAVCEFIGNAFQGMIDFFVEAFSNVSDFVQGVANNIGEFFSNVFSGIGEGLENIGNFFNEVFTNVGQFFQNVFQGIADFGAGIFDGLKTGVENVGNFFSNIFTNVGNFFNTIFTNIGNFFRNIFQGIADFASNIFGGLRTGVENVGNFFGNIFTNIGNFFKNVFNGIKTFAENIFNALKSGFDGVRKFFENILNTIKSVFENIFNGVKNIFENVANFFRNVFTQAWENVKNVFSAVGQFFQNVWNTIVSVFTQVGVAIGNAVSGAFKSVVNAVLSFIENFINGPIRLINGFIGAINDAFGWIGVNIGKLSEVRLPRMETGGIVPGSSYSGDYNLIRANSGEMVLTRDQQSTLFDAIKNGELGGGSKNSFNIEVNVDARGNSEINVRELSTSIAKELKRAFENQGLAPDLRNAGALR